MVKVTSETTGGHKLKRILRQTLARKGVGKVDVGFFKQAKYPDGTPVAAVAAWQEFGTKTIPQRPFFRNALEKSKQASKEIIRRGTMRRYGKTIMKVDRRLANLLGLSTSDHIKQEIVTLDDPPLSPVTIAKKGSTNPLVDTDVMKGSVTWVVT